MSEVRPYVLQNVVAVSDSSQAGEVRRTAKKLAEDVGLPEIASANVAIIATELATNLVKHTPGGEVWLTAVRPSATSDMCSRIELLAIDRGPGMGNVAASMRDGYSNAGTSGEGLGAIRRLSTEFDLYSDCPRGTAVIAKVHADRTGANAFNWSALSRPAPHEQVCGDGWHLAFEGRQAAILVVDGLGHGPHAHEAAQAAIGHFSERPFLEPAEAIEQLDTRLRGTRGAALSIAHLCLDSRRMVYAGFGNISGTVSSVHATAPEGIRQSGLISQNGIVGAGVRRTQTLSYDLPPAGRLIMYSDGINTRWSPDRYPGLARQHPALNAGVMMRDHIRGRDDATVVVLDFGGDPR